MSKPKYFPYMDVEVSGRYVLVAVEPETPASALTIPGRGEVVWTFYGNTVVDVLEEANNWYLVRIPGEEISGWINLEKCVLLHYPKNDFANRALFWPTANLSLWRKEQGYGEEGVISGNGKFLNSGIRLSTSANAVVLSSGDGHVTAVTHNKLLGNVVVVRHYPMQSGAYPGVLFTIRYSGLTGVSVAIGDATTVDTKLGFVNRGRLSIDVSTTNRLISDPLDWVPVKDENRLYIEYVNPEFVFTERN